MIDVANGEILLTLDEAAEYLKCSRRAVEEYVRQGRNGRKLETVRSGRLVRTSYAALARFMAQSEPESSPVEALANTDKEARQFWEKKGIKCKGQRNITSPRKSKGG